MSTEQLEKFETSVEIPKGVNVELKKHMLHVKGPLGKAFKSFRKIPVSIDVKENEIHLKAAGFRKKDYAILNTSRSIIKNLCEGVVTGYTIKMKIIFAHFPITVKVDGKNVSIENFQGERSARIAKIVGATKIVPKGDDITITGPVLTDVSQTAANIQLKSKVKDKDHRVFLDGIYIYDKKTGIEK